ncbi:B12-binding domain-containing radical SAM protein [Rhabdochromatium marinum]|uniref:B12-binding domain-containing radical SAM protein n=1 Tax=Rhabdochromatium marinum TaxID=48729 RepID=UPI001903C209|nr:radical SAM protein [Rhabdochromatium marinum]
MMPDSSLEAFHLYFINPSHYGEDGYVIYWEFPPLPSNTLACLNGLAQDCARRQVLGERVRIEIQVLDESAGPLPLAEIMARIRSGRGLVGLSGVQTHQYPRALDLARQLRREGIPVCIGGFHVSGILAMFERPSPELQEALDLGVSFFRGEAEGGRFDQLLRDAYAATPHPIYPPPPQAPELEGEPGPTLPNEVLARTRRVGPLDVGRGCPFTCSFCTIINVHGRGGRQRRPQEVIATLRTYLRQGVRFFQVTDDNFARLANWREVLTAIAELREEDQWDFGLLIQVDASSYRRKAFVPLCARAGVKFVFIGVESVNEEKLRQIDKPQNQVRQYPEMLRAWRNAGIHVQVGYILGFAEDDPVSMARDVAYLLDEVGFDDVMFFNLTPLPGSVDHRERVMSGEWMDSDLNRYDLHHPVTRGRHMSLSQWRHAYRHAWGALLDYRRIPRYLRQAAADGLDTRLVFSRMVGYRLAVFFHDLHPIEYGQGRLRFREQRRPTRPTESVWRFRARIWLEETGEWIYTRYLHWRVGRIYRKVTGCAPPPLPQRRSEG